MPTQVSFSPSPPPASPDKRSDREVGARRAGVFPRKFLGKAPVLRATRCARGRRWIGWAQLAFGFIVALLACFVCAGSAIAQKPAAKPRVPPGLDPGGVAVAIIGSGIDYTRPEIAARLARDGEGEIIGWDFVDNDRRPYNPCTEAVSVCSILGIGPSASSRMIVIRASTGMPQSMVAAVGMSTSTPARIVLVAFDRPPPLQFLREAARQYPHLLFVGATAFFRDDPRQTILQEANMLALRVEPDAMHPGLDENLIAARLAEHAAKCLTMSQKTNPSEIVTCALKVLRDANSPIRP